MQGFFLAAQFYTRRIHVLQKHRVCFLMAYFFVSIFIYLISFPLKNIISKIHQGWLHSEMGGGLQRWIAGARDLLDKMGNCQIRQKVWTQISDAEISFTFSHACVGEPGQKRVVFPRTFVSVTSPVYMNYFAIVSFDLLNNSSRPLTAPFKAFCRLLNVMYL